MTPWWLRDDSVMTPWWIRYDSVMTQWCLCDDSVMTPWWLRDDSVMIPDTSKHHHHKENDSASIRIDRLAIMFTSIDIAQFTSQRTSQCIKTELTTLLRTNFFSTCVMECWDFAFMSWVISPHIVHRKFTSQLIKTAPRDSSTKSWLSTGVRKYWHFAFMS